jgi:serine/threonine-protein kinase HipA
VTIPAAAESCRAQAPLNSDDGNLAEAIHLAALDRNAARLAAEQSSTPSELLSLLQAGASAGAEKPKALLYFDDSTNSPFLLPSDGRSAWVVKFSSVPHTHKDSRGRGAWNTPTPSWHRLPASACPNPVGWKSTHRKRALFAVRRFDRPVDGARLHRHTLAGLDMIGFDLPKRWAFLVCPTNKS